MSRDIGAALSLHVLSIVIWIGGVSFITTVVLPALRRGTLGADRLRAFAAVESGFVWQARTAILVAGATGLYMVWRMDLWSTFGTPGFWWMDAMVGLWLLFALLLFVAEPFVIDRVFRRWAEAEPEGAFAVSAPRALAAADAERHYRARRCGRRCRLVIFRPRP